MHISYLMSYLSYFFFKICFDIKILLVIFCFLFFVSNFLYQIDPNIMCKYTKNQTFLVYISYHLEDYAC